MASAALTTMPDTTNSSARQRQSTTRPQQDRQPAPSASWARPIRQFGLLAAGAGFLAASIAVSRRAVLRRRLDTIPRFYSSNREGVRVDSSDRSLMAVQALGLATLNVLSFGVLLVGGVSWAFDVSNVAELRARSQAALRKPGVVNPEDEAQMEQMLSDLLGRLGMDPALKEGEGSHGDGSDKAASAGHQPAAEGEARKGG